MQYEITKPSDLLDENGSLIQRGWMKQPILDYNPENKGVGFHRLKEWEFYGFGNQDISIVFFIADLGYMTLSTLSVYDFKNKKNPVWGTIRPFTRGNLEKKGLPKSSVEESDFTFKSWILGKIRIQKMPKEHIVTFDCPHFRGLKGEITFDIQPKRDSTVVATGFKENPKFFYYNHKKNMIPVKGTIQFRKETIDFNPETDHGHFDWGRGVWPYKTHWIWATSAGEVDGHKIWMNMGYGFGDLSTHTENMIIYDGKVHKLDQINIEYDIKNLKKPWKFTSNDGRLELIAQPALTTPITVNLGPILVKNKMMYGDYSGYIVLDDGTKIEVEDFHGHAEELWYRW
ncbi:MAG: DUF2804 domain-containing protein [archaeon]|nr:DUF2804 domain-containing protein [archaeon]